MYYNLFMSNFSPVCNNTKVILPQAPLRYLGISKQNIKMPGWYNILFISNEDRIKYSPY
ncbi:phospholipase carboxylesterase family protein, putative, partial [Ichthyophthirius multifiliis]